MSKPLKFIHITKTAGTSIEDAGRKKGIQWGRHHREYGYWHTIFPNIKKSVIDSYDWFMVVRNPYDRILSEYHCRWGGVGASRHIRHTKEEMNRYLINKITNVKNMTSARISGNHYTEQFRYLHPTVSIHVLKFENLSEEFSNLMSLYTIEGITLPHSNANAKKFRVSDFSKELIDLINEVYAKDFELFGFTMNLPEDTV